jgi:hypothetical protein
VVPTICGETFVVANEEFVIVGGNDIELLNAAAFGAENNECNANGVDFETGDAGCIKDGNTDDGAGITIVKTMNSATPNEIRFVILANTYQSLDLEQDNIYKRLIFQYWK